MRCFAAVPIPASHQQRLKGLVAALQGERLPVKWVAEGSFHVTLKFIGEVEESLAGKVAVKLAEAAKGVPPLGLSLEGMGAFPARGRPRVIWVGVREGEERGDLARLASRMDAALEPLGIPREGRRFSPHLTIGRAREPLKEADRERLLREFAAPAFLTSEVVLYQSLLQPGGPRYTVIKKFPLG